MPHTPRKNRRSRILRKCGGRCWYCGRFPEPGESLTIDHALPRNRGGRNAEDNLLPACGRCNNEKGDGTVSEFRKYCKVRAIRKAMTFGYHGGDLSRIHIVFYGEGGDPSIGF